MPPVNVLVMIHGMTPNPEVRSPFDGDQKYWGYNDFWNALRKEQPKLGELFPSGFIGVEWGHELPEQFSLPVDKLRDDQRLRRAENFVNERVAYDNLTKDPSDNNITMSFLNGRGVDFPWFTPPVRALIVGLRESIVTHGFGDVVYYCSANGETQVRQAVYSQVLKQLDPYVDEPDVRLHLIGQSLGVTLTHDFLYGLFTSKEESDFYHQGNDDDQKRFKTWQDKAGNGQLKLGSLTSTASQLPLFMMRKQKLVDRLAKGELIDATTIGIVDSNRVQWQLFYDVDDLLGFGTRRLYKAGDAIKEFQVDSNDNPGDAHTSYWKNRTVIEKTAELLLTNATIV